MVKEGDKIKLITGEIAIISEVLDENVAYIAEIFVLKKAVFRLTKYLTMIL